jgi:hypothetical protein
MVRTMAGAVRGVRGVAAALGRRVARDDRGDVPGWVLVTLMTAGLVSVLWFVAGDALVQVFQNAIASVTPTAP